MNETNFMRLNLRYRSAMNLNFLSFALRVTVIAYMYYLDPTSESSKV